MKTLITILGIISVATSVYNIKQEREIVQLDKKLSKLENQIMLKKD